MERLRPASQVPRTGPRAGARADRGSTLGPRGVGEMLDAAVDVLRGRFVSCLLPAALLWLLALHFLDQRMTSAIETILSDRSAHVLALWTWVYLACFVTLCTAMLCAAAICPIAHGAVLERPADTLRGLRLFASRLPALLVLVPAILAAACLGFLLFVVPGLYFLWRSWLAPVVAVLERTGPWQAITRSWALTRGALWRWIPTLLVAHLLTLPFSVVAAACRDGRVEAALLERMPALSPVWIGRVAEAVGAVLVGLPSAFLAVVVTVFYVDARIRREGYDLELRLARMARTEARPSRRPALGRRSLA